jgi:hypothetical protein
VPDISGSIGEFAGAIRELLGLTRHNRLRDQLRNSLELFALVQQHSKELPDASNALAEIVTLQATRLLAIVKPERARRWDWGEFVVGLVITAIALWGEWRLWSLQHSWWVWLALVALGVFLIAAVQTTVKALGEHRASTA